MKGTLAFLGAPLKVKRGEVMDMRGGRLVWDWLIMGGGGYKGMFGRDRGRRWGQVVWGVYHG